MTPSTPQRRFNKMITPSRKAAKPIINNAARAKHASAAMGRDSMLHVRGAQKNRRE
jgi:hypothetical protein